MKIEIIGYKNNTIITQAWWICNCGEWQINKLITIYGYTDKGFIGWYENIYRIETAKYWEIGFKINEKAKRKG